MTREIEVPQELRKLMAEVGPKWATNVPGHVKLMVEEFSKVLARCPKDGITIRRDVPYVPGTTEFPLGEADLRAKVLDCFAASPRPLTGPDADEFIGRIEKIEEVGDMRNFFSDTRSAFRRPADRDSAGGKS